MPINKPCKYCGKIMEKVYTHKIFCSDCKKIRDRELSKKYQKEYYQKNKDKLDKQNKQHRLDNPEKYKEYRSKCREKNREKYNLSSSISQKNNRLRNPEIVRLKDRNKKLKYGYISFCVNKVSWAVETGKLVKPLVCSKCGSKRYIQGHHKDYSKPLEVVWLCAICHKQEHIKLKEVKTKLGIEKGVE